MRAPDFWYRPAGMAAHALRPLGAIYAAATARRLRHAAPLAAKVPVICVGNINAGGTGKTPMVMALVQMLQDRGHTVHIVSRGYGGNETGPLRVDPGKHKPENVGDEPLLLSGFAPVWVARDRAAGVLAAQEGGARVIVMDDGHQNPSVKKDLSVICVDAALGFGNGLVIPAGPLREPARKGLARADLVVSIGSSRAQDHFSRTWGDLLPVPALRAELAPLRTGMPWEEMRVAAFAGIGHPEKFFDTLRALGATVVAAHPLADHEPVPEVLFNRFWREAAGLQAQLVTTEKDAARLPAHLRARVLTVPVRLRVEDQAPLDAALDQVMGLNQSDSASSSTSDKSS